MNVAILCQEEPVFLGPFLRRVIAAHPEKIVAVLIAGTRGAGEKKGTLRERLRSHAIFLRILEPRGFVSGLAVRLRAKLLGRRDPGSVFGLARKLGLTVHHVGNPNAEEFRELLQKLKPDLVLNQSELLLKKETLAIPRVGFLNRHASLLPDFRGRLGSFWSHAAPAPRYGVTIHFVDEGVDTGAIVLQREVMGIDPRWPYPRVLARLGEGAPALFWEAVSLLEQPGFEPRKTDPKTPPHRFPTREESIAYRDEMRNRRARSSYLPGRET